MKGDQQRHDRLLSAGIWTWLAIVEQEADKLSESGRNALGLLREDLQRLTTEERPCT